MSDYIEACLQEKAPFREGKMTGIRYRYSDVIGDVYLVISYAVVIASWDKMRGWLIPDEKHSATTSKHQTMVRRVALFSDGGFTDGND